MEWLMMIFGLGGGHQLALCAFDGPCEEGVAGVSDLPHYAFFVGDDAALDAWRERLSCAGIDFKEEDHGAQRSIYLSDPNGIILEITSPPSKPYPSPDPRETARAWIKSHSRSEEHRVGKECGSPCRSRWSPSHSKKSTRTMK